VARRDRRRPAVPGGWAVPREWAGGLQFSLFVIVPERDGKDFAPSYVMLDIAQDPFLMATA